eukprot:scaffold1074_cov409-Prasinococcus_capsulatus_cf.AAC.27
MESEGAAAAAGHLTAPLPSAAPQGVQTGAVSTASTGLVSSVTVGTARVMKQPTTQMPMTRQTPIAAPPTLRRAPDPIQSATFDPQCMQHDTADGLGIKSYHIAHQTAVSPAQLSSETMIKKLKALASDSVSRGPLLPIASRQNGASSKLSRHKSKSFSSMLRMLSTVMLLLLATTALSSGTATTLRQPYVGSYLVIPCICCFCGSSAAMVGSQRNRHAEHGGGLRV